MKLVKNLHSVFTGDIPYFHPILFSSIFIFVNKILNSSKLFAFSLHFYKKSNTASGKTFSTNRMHVLLRLKKYLCDVVRLRLLKNMKNRAHFIYIEY